jgi:hypothetical protein
MSTSRDESPETGAGNSDMVSEQPQPQPAAREPDDIDEMLAGHQSPIQSPLTDSVPLVSATPAPEPLAKKQPSLRKTPSSVSPSPKPAASKGKPIALRPVPMEVVARKPAVPKMNVKRSSPPRQQPGEKNLQDPATVASRMAHMSARERVELGLRQMRSLQDHRPSSAFATSTPRTCFGLTPAPEHKTPQQIKKEQLLEEKIEKARGGSRSSSAAPSDAHATRSLSSFQRYERQSSWARDTVERGLYTFNWTALPQTIPRKHVDPSPGPGAYTSPLHFLGLH